MKIALFGHGKMGKLCEEIACTRGHTITGIVTSTSTETERQQAIADADVLIEFTHPEYAVDHIALAAKHKKNIVVGTTGWYERLPEVAPLIASSKIGCLYSPNFSTGVALFNALLSRAAQLFHGYDAAGIEIHHKNKADAPSGTAQALAKTIEKEQGKTIAFTSVRVGSFPGTHTIIFDSPHDTVTLTHTAHSRMGFAEGAIDAAEWLLGKQGLYSFEDFIATKIKEDLCFA